MIESLQTMIEADTGSAQKVASRDGGEYAAFCPICGGDGRLHFWPHHPDGPKWKCFGPDEGRGGCGEGGDCIAYLVFTKRISKAEAYRMRHGDNNVELRQPKLRPPAPKAERLESPNPTWQGKARAFVEWAQTQLWADGQAPTYLRGRGLADETIRAAGLGWNPSDWWRTPEQWGVEPWVNSRGKPGKLWLPRGWIIPWYVDGDLWRVSVRLPKGRKPKYYNLRMPRGNHDVVYNIGAVTPDKPVMLVEGVFDALTLIQEAGDLVTPVATGTTGGRQARWIAALATAPQILASHDAEVGKGDKAAAWWVDVLPNAKRWRPFWEDANAMAQDGVDLRRWVQSALGDELGAIPVAGQMAHLEAEATALMREDPQAPEEHLSWCRRWADLATRAGWPCTGYQSWAEWVADVERDFPPEKPVHT